MPADCIAAIAARVPAKTCAGAAKKIKALSLTCSRLLRVLSDKTALEHIIHIVAERFKTDLETVAAHLNSPGADVWLVNRIKCEEKLTFEALQKIITFVKILEERGLKENRLKAVSATPPDKDKAFQRTQQGLRLVVCDYWRPTLAISTPWGTLNLLSTVSADSPELLFLIQETLAYLRAKFVDLSTYAATIQLKKVHVLERKNGNFWLDEQQKNFYSIATEPISEYDLKSYRGKQCFLIGEPECVYEVTHVEREEIPAVFLSASPCDITLTNKVKCLLERVNAKEIALPLSLTLEKQMSSDSQKIHNPCAFCKQGNCFINCPLCPKTSPRYCSLECQDADWAEHAQGVHAKIPTLQAIMKDCISLLLELEKQPIFTEISFCNKPPEITTHWRKISYAGNETSWNVCICMNNYAFLVEYGWHLMSIKNAHEIHLSLDYIVCPIENLKTVFEALIAECLLGWTLVKNEDLLLLFEKKDFYLSADVCEDYVVFIKKDRTRTYEPLATDLLESFASAYSMRDKIYTYHHSGSLYLFIKKNALNAFKALFPFSTDCGSFSLEGSEELKQFVEGLLKMDVLPSSKEIVDAVKRLIPAERAQNYIPILHKCVLSARMPIVAAIIKINFKDFLGEKEEFTESLLNQK